MKMRKLRHLSRISCVSYSWGHRENSEEIIFMPLFL